MRLGYLEILRICMDMFLGRVEPIASGGYADLVPDFVKMIQVLRLSVAIVGTDIGHVSA